MRDVKQAYFELQLFTGMKNHRRELQTRANREMPRDISHSTHGASDEQKARITNSRKRCSAECEHSKCLDYRGKGVLDDVIVCK